MSCSTCRHEERDHFDGASPFPGVCAVNACPCTFYRNGVPVDAAQGRARTTHPRQEHGGDGPCLACAAHYTADEIAALVTPPLARTRAGREEAASALTTCLATPPVPGCNCGLVWGEPARMAEEHKARLAARVRDDNAAFAARVAAASRTTAPASPTPASTIRAMAGALGELAPLLTFGPDVSWCRELAHQLERFAVQLPTQDGGEDAAREVRHA